MPDETLDLDALDLDGWLSAQAQQFARGNPDRHPSVEAIYAYHARELSSDESADVQRHLADCQECTQLLLALADTLSEDQSEASDGIDPEEGWRKLRERIKNERKPVAQVSPSSTQTVTRRWHAATYALAALLCAVLLVPLFLHTSGTATRPEPIFVPSASMARTSDLVKRIQIDPSDDKDLQFLLEAPTSISFSAYSLEVRDAEGRLLVKRESVARQHGGFQLTVSPRTLQEGKFEIQVQGIQDGRSRTVGTYWIEVIHR